MPRGSFSCFRYIYTYGHIHSSAHVKIHGVGIDFLTGRNDDCGFPIDCDMSIAAWNRMPIFNGKRYVYTAE